MPSVSPSRTPTSTSSPRRSASCSRRTTPRSRASWRVSARAAAASASPAGGVGDLFHLMAPFQPSPPPGAGNPFDWGREEYVTGLLGEAFEFEFAEGNSLQTGESGEEIWQLFVTSYGPTKMLADSLEPERREELHRTWVEFFEGYRVNGAISQPRQYLVVLGTRR